MQHADDYLKVNVENDLQRSTTDILIKSFMSVSSDFIFPKVQLPL